MVKSPVLRALILGLVIGSLGGCVIPLPNPPQRVSDEQLLTIKHGQTSRAEVVAVLGQPDVIWETERVFVYEEGPTIRLLWIIPGNYSAAFLLSELGEDIIIMRFDEADRIERLDRRIGRVAALPAQDHVGHSRELRQAIV